MIAPRSNVISTRPALLSMTTIIVLVMLRVFSRDLYATNLGRFPAMMIEIMASRTLTFAWSPAGYYEELFDAGRMNRQQILFHSTTFVRGEYRIRRLRPNLADVTDWVATDTPINRFGYIGPQWSIAKPLNTRRVAVLGDSVTEGFGVNMDQGFVNLLANRLNATAASEGVTERFEFLNFAVSAYHLTQMMDVALRDTPQFHPDVYMVSLTELSVYRSWNTHLDYLVQAGVDPKYDFLRDTISRAKAKQADDEATLDAKFAPFRMSIVRQAILRMKENAELHHAQFVVVLLPSVEDAEIARRRFAGIPELLSSMNITFIDLSDTFTPLLDRQSVRLSSTDVHPNVRGHEMICDNLYKKLRANPDAWSKLVGPALSDNRQPGPSQ